MTRRIAWPSMRASFDVPLGALGLLLPLAIGAYVVSSSATGLLLRRLGIGRLLAASTGLSGVALFAWSVVPNLLVVIALGVLMGIALDRVGAYALGPMPLGLALAMGVTWITMVRYTHV